MAGRYVLSILTAALIGGIVTGILPGGGLGKLLKLLCGLFLLAAVMQPLGALEVPDIDGWVEKLDQEAQAAAAQGEDYFAAQQRRVISQRLEAYILDKAAELGFEPTVELTLDASGCPQAAALRGSYTEFQRGRLEELLENDLGIPKESQRWDEET